MFRTFIMSRLDDAGAELAQTCSEETRRAIAEHDVAIREHTADQIRELVDGLTADVLKVANDTKRELENMVENATSEVRVGQENAFKQLEAAQDHALKEAEKRAKNDQQLTMSHLSIIDKLVRTQTSRLDDMTPRLTAIKVRANLSLLNLTT